MKPKVKDPETGIEYLFLYEANVCVLNTVWSSKKD